MEQFEDDDLLDFNEYSEDNIENLYEDFIFDDIFKTDSLIAILWIDSENI